MAALVEKLTNAIDAMLMKKCYERGIDPRSHDMDSSLLRSYKSKLDSDEALQIADNKYISQVYFHTLFLYSILKQKKLRFSLDESQGEKALEVDGVLRDLFKSSYCEFLLRFGGTEELIAAID